MIISYCRFILLYAVLKVLFVFVVYFVIHCVVYNLFFIYHCHPP